MFVLITSRGLVTIDAAAPAMPAQRKYQDFWYVRSWGLTKVFMFSLTHTTTEVKGKFMNTVMGYDLNKPKAPSFLQMSAMQFLADTFVSCILCLMTSEGAIKKSCAKVVDAPIAILWKKLN